jgi:antitoxin Phd
MDTWTLQDAKARFSELVNRAETDGPQLVTRHGKNTVVIISYSQFCESASIPDFKSFLLSSRGVSDIEVVREKHFGRTSDFEVLD